MRPSLANAFSPRPSRLCGWLYLGIVAGGLYAKGFVRSRLVNTSDAGKTAEAILNAEPLYRSGLAADRLVLTCDVGVAASFRLDMVGIAGATALNQAGALALLKNAAGIGHFSVPKVQELDLQALRMHGSMYGISLIFFGLSCLLLGHLLMHTGLLPRAIGAALMVAGACYLGSSGLRIVWPRGAANLFSAAFIPSLIAEVSLPLCLIVLGIKAQAARTLEA